MHVDPLLPFEVCSLQRFHHRILTAMPTRFALYFPIAKLDYGRFQPQRTRYKGDHNRARPGIMSRSVDHHLLKTKASISPVLWGRSMNGTAPDQASPRGWHVETKGRRQQHRTMVGRYATFCRRHPHLPVWNFLPERPKTRNGKAEIYHHTFPDL